VILLGAAEAFLPNDALLSIPPGIFTIDLESAAAFRLTKGRGSCPVTARI